MFLFLSFFLHDLHFVATENCVNKTIQVPLMLPQVNEYTSKQQTIAQVADQRPNGVLGCNRLCVYICILQVYMQQAFAMRKLPSFVVEFSFSCHIASVLA